MSAKFYQRTITPTLIPSLTKNFVAKFYLADPGDFVLEATRKVDIPSWGKYGTNASFFMLQSGTAAYMTALHITNNQSVGDATGDPSLVQGGGNNYAVGTSSMDYMFKTIGIGVSPRTSSWTNIPNMEWGIGGYNLLLNDASIINSATFKTALSTYYNNIGINNIPYYQQVPRTVIGYRGGSDQKVILVTLFGDNGSGGATFSDGPNYYEVSRIMKYFGCSVALALDGSTCTKISYKNSSGQYSYVQSGSRETWCRFRLTDSAAASCDWTGV